MNGWLIEECEDGYRATRPGATLIAPTREEVERKARGYDAQQAHMPFVSTWGPADTDKWREGMGAE